MWTVVAVAAAERQTAVPREAASTAVAVVLTAPDCQSAGWWAS